MDTLDQNGQSDQELIRAYLYGDPAAFDLLYERYRRPLYGYLKNLLRGEQANLDDIFQKTWLKAIDNLHRYENREKFSAWLMRIAYHLTIDLYRKGKRLAESEFDEKFEALLPADESFAPDSQIRNRELADAIEEAVQTLSPEIRSVFLMRCEDLSFKEIAAIQKCSINTCLARMQYALKKLRVQLGNWMQ
ncbi:MAG: sigma-70 family RNA polymerase sigma factor [Lentisphaeria bacterium]|nr:sigma-70 family RNA polymerase sigma factor [Lentisphaeria bacterium]